MDWPQSRIHVNSALTLSFVVVKPHLCLAFRTRHVRPHMASVLITPKAEVDRCIHHRTRRSTFLTLDLMLFCSGVVHRVLPSRRLEYCCASPSLSLLDFALFSIDKNVYAPVIYTQMSMPVAAASDGVMRTLSPRTFCLTFYMYGSSHHLASYLFLSIITMYDTARLIPLASDRAQLRPCVLSPAPPSSGRP